MIGAFSLKFQRDNQQNALAMDSTDGKTGEKAVFPQHGENTAFLSGFSADGLHDWDIFEQLNIWLCHSTCLFHLYSTLKYSLFSSFPLGDFMAEAFCWLFPWNVIQKGINLFL